jgi:sugar transferase (PEP-CTERM/EpsH1 system associated)
MATILFLAHRIPYPPNKGDKLRAYQLLDHWAKYHKVFLGCFIDNPEDLRHRDLLRERCADAYFARLHPRRAAMRAFSATLTQGPMGVRYYHDRGLAAWISRIMASEQPEHVFVFSSAMGQYVLEAPKSSRVIVDFVDVDSEKWAAYAATKRFPARQIYRREARELLRFDRRLAARADASIFVSEPEAELFRSRAPEVGAKVFAISNGVDSTYFSPKNAGSRPNFKAAPIIVFTGQMSYWPNVDAVMWFSDAVLPALREKFPGTSFYIVGAHPSARVRALSLRPGIVVTGHVPDTRPYVGHAEVVVAPLRIGRGVQNKVLEGMAMARPVIVTSSALEGIDAIPDHHVLLARNSEEFVRSVEKAMDLVFAERIGMAARKKVLKSYRWADSLVKYDRLFTCLDNAPSLCDAACGSTGVD